MSELNINDIEGEDLFSIDVEGYEGPLHLLLDMARRQKVDLLHVSILDLSNQYLEFIQEARSKRIDLAAEYLLMAAWLAYLKSRLLLPKQDQVKDGEGSADEMAAQLAFRLKRLEAMREAGEALMDGRIFGRDVFSRGQPERPKVISTTEYDTTVWHLMQAFGTVRQRQEMEAPHAIENQYVLPLEQARDRLRDIRVKLTNWASLDDIRAQIIANDDEIPNSSATASVFSAALELTRDGEVDVRQEQHFGPLYLKTKSPDEEEAA